MYASTHAETKVALVQRSCGYALRPTLRIDEIERAVKVSGQAPWWQLGLTAVLVGDGSEQPGGSVLYGMQPSSNISKQLNGYLEPSANSNQAPTLLLCAGHQGAESRRHCGGGQLLRRVHRRVRAAGGEHTVVLHSRLVVLHSRLGQVMVHFPPAAAVPPSQGREP